MQDTIFFVIGPLEHTDESSLMMTIMDPGANDSEGTLGLPPGNQTDLLAMFSGTQLLLRFKPLFMPLYGAVVMVAGVGNAFLLACIVVDRKLHNATNFFIGNLAAGDLLMCLSCVPLTASYAFDPHGWAFGRPLCHLVPLIQGATVFASVLSLTAIAMDRYVVVAYPVRRRISMRGCSAVAVVVWVLALALAAPPALHVRLVDLRPSGVDFLVCEEFWEAERMRLLYSCFFLLASYMIPLLAVSVSYCAISLHLRRHAMPGEPCQPCGQQQQRWTQRRRRTFSLLVASVLAFALCWLPLQVLNLMVDLDGDFRFVDKHYLNMLQVSCHLVAMSSACYNPFIYASLHSKLRLHLRGYLWPCRAGREGGGGGGRGGRGGGGGGGVGGGRGGRDSVGSGGVTLLSRCTSRNPNTCLSVMSEPPAKEQQNHHMGSNAPVQADPDSSI
ncbi:7 transmembrane receptor domain-containing protein [Alosa sapidissima]|uniref:7 transmembrane receptor domain-containing protein n=1 Tax=Alosa sapidissima TaxID=34773 RepID=UPI001C092F48|nr:7 transmembrane receptor domain-containing protein [Alosa sapidissima]